MFKLCRILIFRNKRSPTESISVKQHENLSSDSIKSSICKLFLTFTVKGASDCLLLRFPPPFPYFPGQTMRRLHLHLSGSYRACQEYPHRISESRGKIYIRHAGTLKIIVPGMMSFLRQFLLSFSFSLSCCPTEVQPPIWYEDVWLGTDAHSWKLFIFSCPLSRSFMLLVNYLGRVLVQVRAL